MLRKVCAGCGPCPSTWRLTTYLFKWTSMPKRMNAASRFFALQADLFAIVLCLCMVLSGLGFFLCFRTQ